MVIRTIKVDDLPEVERLYTQLDKENGAISYISGTGVLSEESGQVNGCAFLYLTNSPICHIDLFCIDKSIKKDKRPQVITDIIQGLLNMAKGYGYKYIIANPLYRKSSDYLLENGFTRQGDGTYWQEIN